MTFFELYAIGFAVTFSLVAILDPKPRQFGLFPDLFAYTFVGLVWPFVWFLQVLELLVRGLHFIGRLIRG